jgi:hypothetical protein
MAKQTNKGANSMDRGWRYQETAPVVGSILAHSNVWVEDEPTDEELPGTCCFETVEACEKYAQWSKGYIIEVEGVRICGGDLADETIIDEARVVSVRNWRL